MLNLFLVLAGWTSRVAPVMTLAWSGLDVEVTAPTIQIDDCQLRFELFDGHAFESWEEAVPLGTTSFVRPSPPPVAAVGAVGATTPLVLRTRATCTDVTSGQPITVGTEDQLVTRVGAVLTLLSIAEADALLDPAAVGAPFAVISDEGLPDFNEGDDVATDADGEIR